MEVWTEAEVSAWLAARSFVRVAVKKERSRLNEIATGHSVGAWTVDDVSRWLRTKNCAGVDVDHFKSEGIDGDMLLSLDDDTLHSLGISVALDRKVFRAAIDQLLDPVVAAEHDPAIARALESAEGARREVARLAALHDADTTAIASAEEAAAVATAELEALKTKQAAMQTSDFGRAAIHRARPKAG